MLFERDTELQRLADLTAEAMAGAGRVIALSGEAGIGKSSLLREFVAGLSDQTRAYWGMCDALFTPRPLGPVQDIAALLLDQDEYRGNEGAIALFPQLFARLQQSDTPAVLIIEDVHWADVGTLDFIRFLGRRIALCPVLLVISFRDDEVGRDHPLRRVLGDLPSDRVERIELSPLSIEAVRQLAAGSERNAERLLQITGGNPFFVSEILSDKSDEEARVPESVQDAVAGRLARLDEKHRSFLEALSIIPVPIEPALHGRWIEDHEQWIEQSIASGILVSTSDGRLRFRHELARLATSQRCSSHELVRLHQKHLALMLELPDKFAACEIVHHAKGALDAKAVLDYAPVAGERAARLGAHSEAAAYFETALDFVDEASPELAAELYESWAYEAGLALKVDDRVIEARRHALTLWRAIGREDKVAENLRRLSRLHWYRGEAAQAGRYLDDSIALFEQLDDAEKLAMAYSMRSQMMMLNSRMDEAIDWGHRALETAGSEPPAEILVHALNNIGTAKLFLGQEDGLDDLQRSLSLALDNHLHEDAARVFTNLSEYAVDLRKLDLAEEVLHRGIAFDVEHDLDSWTFYLRGRQAQLRLEQGRLQEAKDIAEIVLARPDQTMLMQLPARIMLGKAQLRMGQSGAGQTLEQARADALQTSEVQYQIPVLLTLMERAWLADDMAKAKEAFASLKKIDAHRFSKWGRAEFAFWAQLCGGWKVPGLGKAPHPFRLALEGEMTAASEAFSALGSHYLSAICLGLQDDPERISDAVAQLQQQEAAAAINRLVTLAVERGIAREAIRIARGPYKAARTNSFGLTAKEQTVLGLMTEGLSNGEIAERLSRSPRTVEHHVSSILQKLDAESRLGAVLKAQQYPELDPEITGRVEGSGPVT
ncbi:LuxR family transcriptional regulator [Altererythrobacter sp. ZODW24]|uniref:ATP-binding protein n=1 Tax=Altererythrobacter sp. ZODW24 TaxID=2185142 RepID=UPI000DF762F7|nr:LuxR family transcriptional regulator [Altererythrobacter sp. ZODW24]